MFLFTCDIMVCRNDRQNNIVLKGTKDMLTNSATINIKHAFIQLGMTDEHADVYLANLLIGSAPASAIARKAKVPRSTTYDILEQLIDWRFVTETEKKKKKYYTVDDPGNLEDQMVYKRNRVADIAHVLKKDLFQLEALYAQNQPNSPKNSFFQGEDALSEALGDSLMSEEILRFSCGFFPTEDANHLYLPDYLEGFHRQLKIRNINTKEIFYKSELIEDYAKNQKTHKHTQIIVLPIKNPLTKNGVDKHIYDNKVCYISHREKTAQIIEDKEICDFERMLFEASWDLYIDTYGKLQ